MSNAKKVSAEILKASKAAAAHVYDTSKYSIVNTQVKRDTNTGRLILKNTATK